MVEPRAGFGAVSHVWVNGQLRFQADEMRVQAMATDNLQELVPFESGGSSEEIVGGFRLGQLADEARFRRRVSARILDILPL